MRKTKKKMEFSKLIVICATIATLFIILFSCFMTFKTEDLTPLSYLIPSVFAQLASTLGLYLHKAKSENLLKIARTIRKEELDATIITSNDNI